MVRAEEYDVLIVEGDTVQHCFRRRVKGRNLFKCDDKFYEPYVMEATILKTKRLGGKVLGFKPSVKEEL